ncbi:MAG: hypothetical protein ACYYK0_06740 [Candidatus Eutrophobiaceae bacterium]
MKGRIQQIGDLLFLSHPSFVPCALPIEELHDLEIEFVDECLTLWLGGAEKLSWAALDAAEATALCAVLRELRECQRKSSKRKHPRRRAWLFWGGICTFFLFVVFPLLFMLSFWLLLPDLDESAARIRGNGEPNAISVPEPSQSAQWTDALPLVEDIDLQCPSDVSQTRLGSFGHSIPATSPVAER